MHIIQHAPRDVDHDSLVQFDLLVIELLGAPGPPRT